MYVTNGTQYLANSGARLIINGRRPALDKVFYRTTAGDYRTEITNVSHTSFDMFVPQLTVRGTATIEPDGTIIWHGWAYKPLLEPFNGELTFVQENTKGRVGFCLMVGMGDGNVVYVSSDGHGSDYRAFIAKVNTDGGTLPRIAIVNQATLWRGRLTVPTEIGTVDTSKTSWRRLSLDDYVVNETLTEVQFSKK